MSENREVGFRSDSERALLAYLLIERNQPHRRESLGAIFWPDVAEKHARNNLRVSLHRMRQAIEEKEQEVVIANKQELRLNGEADVWVDVWAFEDALDSVDSHSHEKLTNCAYCLEDLTQAIGLYRGPFLKGFMLEGSQAFLEWTIIKQEWLHRRALESLATLTEGYVEVGEYETAEDFARRQLELEPWREKAHYQLMLILALRGERSAALTQYETCRKVLQDELAVAPSEATKNLVEKIRSGEGYDEILQVQVGVSSDKSKLSKNKWQFNWLRVFGILGIAILAVALIMGALNGWTNVNLTGRQAVFWEFDEKDNLEGWIALNHLGPMTIEEGELPTTRVFGF